MQQIRRPCKNTKIATSRNSQPKSPCKSSKTRLPPFLPSALPSPWSAALAVEPPVRRHRISTAWSRMCGHPPSLVQWPIRVEPMLRRMIRSRSRNPTSFFSCLRLLLRRPPLPRRRSGGTVLSLSGLLSCCCQCLVRRGCAPMQEPVPPDSPLQCPMMF